MSSSPGKLDQHWPSQVKAVTLREILEETQGREILLEERIRQMAQRYNCSLEELEARLARGEGREHPDWEDSIEWRNAVEALQRARTLQNILEWLVNSLAPSPTS
ncbi:MAG: hypothetical protein U9R48_10920 [Chloroflexota bacterium]|nr:hypothetical protein [Chloroflexota bacterium]